MGCLYSLTSPSGKSYIGISTKSAVERWDSHVAAAAYGRETAIAEAIRKYGAQSFSVSTLVIADDWQYLCDLERKSIKAFETKSPKGYNLTDGGEGTIGYERDEKYLAKVSAAQKLRYSSPEDRKKLIAQAAVANEAMRAAHAARRINGMTPTEARKEAAREFPKRKANTPRADHEKKKISEAVKAAWQDPATRAKMLAGLKKRDREVLVANGKNNAGKKRGSASESRKAKIRDKQLASWSDEKIKCARLANNIFVNRKTVGENRECAVCGNAFRMADWEVRTRPNKRACSKDCYLIYVRKPKN